MKNAAVEVFGEFISLINKEDADNFIELLDFYVDTIQKLVSKGKRDDKIIIQKCAYNFPAVLLFFGKNSWEKLRVKVLFSSTYFKSCNIFCLVLNSL